MDSGGSRLYFLFFDKEPGKTGGGRGEDFTLSFITRRVTARRDPEARFSPFPDPPAPGGGAAAGEADLISGFTVPPARPTPPDPPKTETERAHPLIEGGRALAAIRAGMRSSANHHKLLQRKRHCA